MTGRYVALLRGINVGTAKRVGMADLRLLVEGLGCSDVSTLLNSGNVVFSALQGEPGKIAVRMQKAMESKLGVSARVMVMSGDELAAVVAANPLLMAADNPSRLLVGILGDVSDRERLTEIVTTDWGQERIALGAEPGGQGPDRGSAARAVYMWMPDGVIESKLNAAVGKVLGDGVTARNWSTMLKLREMTEKGAQ